MKNKKIVPNEEIKLIRKEEKKQINIDINDLTSILNFNKDISELNEDIFKLFPNIRIAIEIMTSSILSPNTMTNENYNLTIKNKILPLDIIGSIVNTIKDYTDNTHKFKDKLYNIIEETIYTKGSYCELTLPPDLIIDIYKESKKKKSKLSAGIEEFMGSYNNVSNTNIIDNYKVKKELDILDKQYEESKLLNITENYGLFMNEEIIEDYINNSLNSKIDSGLEDSIVIDNILMLDDSFELENDFKKAFVKKIPSESVLPVSNKDEPKKHYGYFVFLNSIGTPITSNLDINVNNSNVLNIGLANENKKISDGEKIIKKASDSLVNITKKAPNIKNKKTIIEELLITKIKTTLKNSVIKDLINYDIELNNELIDLLYRKIENSEKINIVFVPSRYLMYYAINYRDNGTGKSLLEDILMLSSIKAMLFLTRISSYLRNSIITTDINVELDEDDPDPDRTLAKVLNYVKKSRQMQLPLGITKVNDLVDWLHNVGFKITANSPKLPQFKLDYSENTLSGEVPPSDLEELVEKYIALTLGVTPEMIDNSYSPDFATTIVANNVLMSRRVYMKQKLLNPLLSEHIKKYIQNDPLLYNKIKNLVIENISKIKKKLIKSVYNKDLKDKLSKLKDGAIVSWVIKEIINSIEVTLPKPELQEDDPNAELFDKLSEKLDNVLDVILSSDMFDSELLGDLADKVDSQKNILKGLIVYKWMSENRFLPEVTDIFNINEDGKPVFNLADEYKTLVNALKANIVPLLKEMNKFKKKSDEQLEKIDEDTDSDLDNDTDNDVDNNDNSEENNDTDSDNTETNNEETEPAENTDDTEEDNNKEDEANDNEDNNTNNEENSEEDEKNKLEDEGSDLVDNLFK